MCHNHSWSIRNLRLMIKCVDIIMGHQVIPTSQFFFLPSFHHLTLLHHTRRSRGYKSRSLEPEYRQCFLWFLWGWSRCFAPSLVPLHSGEAELDRDLGKLEGAGLCLGLVIAIMFLEHILKVIFCSGRTHYGADLQQREGETYPPWTGHWSAAGHILVCGRAPGESPEAWEEHGVPPSVE